MEMKTLVRIIITIRRLQQRLAYNARLHEFHVYYTPRLPTIFRNENLTNRVYIFTSVYIGAGLDYNF